jgi:hypothetical protein
MTNSPFLESIRHVMRTKHYLIQIELTYLLWIKRFILFNQKRHPKNLGEQEVTTFLTHLAVNREVTSSTQNSALCAIVLMTSLPASLARKYPNAVKELKWQYLFPSTTRCEHPYDGHFCRHHLHSTALACG